MRWSNGISLIKKQLINNSLFFLIFKYFLHFYSLNNNNNVSLELNPNRRIQISLLLLRQRRRQHHPHLLTPYPNPLSKPSPLIEITQRMDQINRSRQQRQNRFPRVHLLDGQEIQRARYSWWVSRSNAIDIQPRWTNH